MIYFLRGNRARAYEHAMRYLQALHNDDERQLHHDMLAKGLCDCPICLLRYGGVLNIPKGKKS